MYLLFEYCSVEADDAKIPPITVNTTNKAILKKVHKFLETKVKVGQPDYLHTCI